MNKSFLLGSHVENRTTIKQSGYFSYQFDLPFQLPIQNGVNIGTHSERKLLLNRNRIIETDNGKKYFSTVEIVSLLISPNKLDITNEYLKKKFSESIEYLNYFISCFIRIKGPEYPELREITKQDLPKKINYFYMSTRSVKEERMVTGYYTVKSKELGQSTGKVLARPQLHDVADYMELAMKDPFFEILKYYDRANYAQRQGHYQEAVIHLGTYMEMFLYKITEFLMINEQKPDIKINNVMNSDNFGNVIDTQFSKIFNEYGIVYDRKKTGNNLYDYWNIVYKLRCEVVHKGKKVAHEDTLEVFKISRSFVTDIVENLLNEFFDKSIYDFSHFLTYTPKPILDYEL
ncbi:hypothetical protein [Enterococcus sp. AZ103]|uniref:hypothetical protein n=1 Tax=Enterococcus sp. AZ103 TaxID=2774628 RepID=UPI003F25A962